MLKLQLKSVLKVYKWHRNRLFTVILVKSLMRTVQPTRKSAGNRDVLRLNSELNDASN